VSQIKAVSLNTDYQLEVSWSDGTTTGLTGSGGERTIIAAALLIAMRKAYTPGVPILMLDGVMESLDPRPREEFLSFLEEYAKEEDIAIVVSAFDSGASIATVMTR
jgi:ABC-type thiamine transport system ATPase subunit